jgi:hypothetical protein
MLERETGAERRHVGEPGYLSPLKSRGVPALHPHRQMQRESFANSLPISFFTHGSRRRVERSEKRREWLHEAIDFIRVFANFEFAK